MCVEGEEMTKQELQDVVQVFKQMLQRMYAEAGIEIPEEVYPETETDRLLGALEQKYSKK